MAIESEIRQKSLAELIKKHKVSTPAAIEFITDVNQFAADAGITLSRQSPKTQRLIQKALTAKAYEHADAAHDLFIQIHDQGIRETVGNQTGHRNQGRFNTTPLHTRAFRDQLQDHDVAQLIPQSHANIVVIDSCNQYDGSSIQSQRVGFEEALANPEKKHILMPIGPGHWRSLCLTKPTAGDQKYALEIFDPYGSKGAETIKKFALEFLKQCGLDSKNIRISYTGPRKPQKDGYACGDFTCSYINQKVRDLGGQHYNAALIATYEAEGNHNDALRRTSRAESQKISPQQAIAATSAPTPKATAMPKAIAKPKVQQPAPLGQQERKIIQKALEGNDNNKNSSNYKELLQTLLLSRNSIFEQAEKTNKKGKLSDEELAAKLQVAEFRLAGIKPK